MARVAVAYVEVRPDMTKFATLLQAELKAMSGTVHVGVETDKSKLDVIQKAVSDAATKSVAASTKANQRIEAAQQAHAARMQAINDKMLKNEVNQMLAEQEHGLSQRLANEKRAATEQARITSQRITHEGRLQAAADKQARDAADEISKTQKQALDERLRNATAAGNKLRRLEAGATSARIARERGEASRLNTIANNSLKNRLRIINEGARRRLLQERASADLAARTAAEDFAKTHVEEWRKRVGKVSVDESRSLERAMTDRFGAFGGRLARATVRDFDREIDKSMRAAGNRAGRGFVSSLFDRMKLDINLRLGRLAPILAILAATAAPLVKVLDSLAASMVSVAAAAGQMFVAGGAATVSALGAMAQAAITATFALAGMGDALKDLNELQAKTAAGVRLTQGEVDKYRMAMANLSPAGRDVVGTLGQVHTQLGNVRRGVQQSLLANMAGAIHDLAGRYLPVLRTELGSTAGVLNKVALGFVSFMNKASTVGRVRNIMAGNTAIVQTLGKAMVPLVNTALRLGQAFLPLGQMLARYVENWAKAVDRTTGANEASGRLATTVRGMGDALSQLHRIVGSVGGALKATFSASLGTGRTLLDMFANLTSRWENWAKSVTGQSAIAEWAASALPVMQSLGRLVSDLFGMWNRLAKAADAVSFVDQIRTILPPLERLLIQLSGTNATGAFARSLADVGNAIADLNVGGILADAIQLTADLFHAFVDLIHTVPGAQSLLRGLIAALTTLAAIRLAGTLTGLFMLPKAIAAIQGLAGSTVILYNFTKAWLGFSAVGRGGELAFALSNVVGQVRGFGVALVGVTTQMWATTTASQAAAVGVRGLTAAIVANPIGAAIVAITAVVGVIWALAASSDSATRKVLGLNDALAGLSSPTNLDEINAKIKELDANSNNFWKDLWANKNAWQAAFGADVAPQISDTTQAIIDQQNALVPYEARVKRLRAAYGENFDAILEKLRSFGLSAKVTDQEVVQAMSNIQTAAGTTGLTTEQMVRTLANNFNVLSGAVGNAANNVSNAYMGMGKKALESAGMQILAHQQVLKAAGAAGWEYYGQAALVAIGEAQKALKAETTKISTYKPPTFNKGAFAAAGRKAGMATGAGFITSFTGALSELKAKDLLGRSAAWTKVGSNISTYIAKGMTSGTKNITNVSKFISKKFGKTYIKQIQDQIKAYRAALTVVDPATGKKQGKEFWQNRLQEIKDFKSAVVSSLTAGADMVNYFGFVPTPKEVQNRLDELLRKQRDFTKKLAKLQEKGLDKDLAKAWLEAGYETAGNLVEGLQDATPEQVQEISKTFRTIGKEATATADAQATRYYEIGQTQVEKIIKGINTKTAAAEKAIQDLLNKALTGAKKALDWTSLGEQMMNDYNTGVTSGSAGAATATSNAISSTGTAAKTAAAGVGSSAGTAMLTAYGTSLSANPATTHAIIQKALKGGKTTTDVNADGTAVGRGIGTAVMTAYRTSIAANPKTTHATIQKALKGGKSTKDINADGTVAGTGLGKAVISGYQKGLVDKAKTTHDIIYAVLRGDEKAARLLLKAKSPSQVWANVGSDTMAGYAEGVSGMKSTVVRAVNGVLGAVNDVPAATLATPTMGKPGFASPSALAGSSMSQTVNVRVYVGDKEITDIVRTEVDNYDTTRARALLAGRRGG